MSNTLTTNVSNGVERIAITSPGHLSTVDATGTLVKVTTQDPAALIESVEVVETTTGDLVFRTTQPPWQGAFTWSGTDRSTSFVATVRYTNGAVLNSSPVTVSLSNTPSFTVNLLSDYQNSVAPTAIPLTASGTVVGQPATRVEYFVNGSSVGSATSAPFFVPWLAATAGTFEVYAVAANASSESVGSIVTPVTVLATPVFAGVPVSLDATASELSAVFAVQAPASSAVTIGGIPASFDFFQNRATVTGVPLQLGPNLLDIKVTLADGRSYTQPWIYTRSNTTQYGLEINPTTGSGGLSAQITFRDIETAGYASVRLKCASNSGQDATGQPDYTVAQIKASGGLTCIYPGDARVYRVAIDFLGEPTKDTQGNIIAPGAVLERQVRYVTVTDPNTFRAQSTYGSFLAHLALGDVDSAVAVGFAEESRATYASAFGNDPIAIKKIANGLPKIVVTEQSSDQIHLRIDLDDGEIGDVFMHRDTLGIWRISQL